MQAWNQTWGGQPSGTTSYPGLGGFPPGVAGVPPPGVATAGPSPIGHLQGYPIGGYQWPNYPATAVGTYPGAQWPLGQQTQQWEHWQHWQQQYNQWQQQYGDKFAMTPPGSSVPPNSGSLEAHHQPTVTTEATFQNSSTHLAPSDSSGTKRHNEVIGDSVSQQDTKKLCTANSQSTESWASHKASITKEHPGLEELSEAEKQFDEQFRNWETQFNTWREQNANHPDTEQYKAYEAKWKSWREQLLQRREQMRKKREAKVAEAATKEHKSAKSSSNRTVSSNTTTVSTSSSHVSQPAAAAAAVTSTNYKTQPVYTQVGFPTAYSFGQQVPNYMFGITPAAGPTPTSTPGFPGATQTVFSGVPPPAVSSSSVPLQADKVQDQSKNVTSSQGKSTPAESEQQSEFLKPSSGNGIPGLDLLNQPGAKPTMMGEPPVSLMGQIQLPIQTPADSKPFDFPPPNNNKYHPQQGGMPQMSMPPPGFHNVAGYGPHSNLGKQNAYCQPPPVQMNKTDPFSSDNSPRNRSMENYDMNNSSADWSRERKPADLRHYSSVPVQDSNYSRFGYSGQGNNFPNKNDRVGSYGRENDFQKRQPNSYDDKWQSDKYNKFAGANSANSYTGRNDYVHPNSNSDRVQTNSDMGLGPDSEEAEYERFHEYQQSGLNQQNDKLQSSNDKAARRGGGSNGKTEGGRGPRISRFTDRDDIPFKANSEGTYDKFPSPNMSNRQVLTEGVRRNHSSSGSEDIGFRDPARNGRNQNSEDKKWNDGDKYFYKDNSNNRWEKIEGKNDVGSKSESLLEPMVIIDYKHQPADLGTPDIHEPATLIDYAHGAHAIPTEEEEGYSHVAPGSRPYIDPWNSDIRDRGRGVYDRGSPNRHWGDSRGRTRWNRDDRRWDGKDDYKRDSRSRESSRSKEESRGRDDRWRDRRKDSNCDDRGRLNNRDVDKKDRDRDRDKDKNADEKRSQTKVKSPSPNIPSEPIEPEKIVEEQKQVVVLSDDILALPGRALRSSKIVIILRGPPGSGKTFVAKLIKDKEVDVGGSAPRILSLDDYFMSEVEKEEVDIETGRKVTKKVMEYEYEAAMELNYRDSLTKAFRKTVIDGYFPFIIVDAVNDKLSHFEEMASFAKSKGFLVYICDMDMDSTACFRRNIHRRKESEIEDIIKNWENTPSTYISLDVRSLLQDAAIPEVDMEDTVEDGGKAESCDKEDDSDKNNDNRDKEDENIEEDHEASGLLGSTSSSKWDALDSTYDKLDRLDGLSKARRPRPTITDWLQLPEDYFETTNAVPGKKQVRWADLEERRQQEKMRAIGFVVGQTDWSRMLDPSGGQSKLTQTKYI